MDFKSKLYKLNPYSPNQFSIFRIVLGSYLIIHFTMLLPYAQEIWSSEGLLANANLNLTHGYFPNILNYNDSPLFVYCFVATLIGSSVLLVVGIQRPIISFILWYGWVCLFDRNNLISNPSIPFIGWILLCFVVIPMGEPFCLFSHKNSRWKFPPLIFIGAWAIMSIGYTISGFDKLNSPSWQDGTAIIHLLQNPLARDWGFRTLFLSVPEKFLQLITWGILFVELVFLPFAIWPKTRKWIWLAMILMHLGILLVVDFADLTIGMLMIHWFTFDKNWFPIFNSKTIS